MSEAIQPNGKAGAVADLTQAFEADAKSDASRLDAFRTALGKLVEEAQAALEVKVKALMVRAKDGSETLRTVAAQRATEADALVKERPYVALGAAALAGFLLGHLLSAGRPQVVYLRDGRPL